MSIWLTASAPAATAITLAYGKPIFDLFAERPEQAETFQRAMTRRLGHRGAIDPRVLRFLWHRAPRRSWRRARAPLASVLQKYPGMQGVLFDLPEVVAGVPPIALSLAASLARRRLELLRARAARLRRLHDEAHHPRLGR